MPCYDSRNETDRIDAQKSVAVRGFLLCKLMSTGNDDSIRQIADRWFRLHHEVDLRATLAKSNQTPAAWREAARAASDLIQFEREIHQRLVGAGILERI